MRSLFDDGALDDVQRQTPLVAVLRLATRDAAPRIAPDSDPASPKVFTQRQLLALPVLRKFTKTTYRGVVERLIMMPPLRDAIGLKRPGGTTLRAPPRATGVTALRSRRCESCSIRGAAASLLPWGGGWSGACGADRLMSCHAAIHRRKATQPQPSA